MLNLQIKPYGQEDFYAEPATKSSLIELSSRIRDIDARECAAIGSDPRRGLLAGFYAPGICLQVVHKDKVIGAFGATMSGSLWSLWADLTLEQSKLIRRYSDAWLDKLCRDADAHDLTLCNHVSTENLLAIKWLKRSGRVDFWPQEAIETNDGTMVPFILRSQNK